MILPENPDQGIIVLFRQQFSAIRHVPPSFFLGSPSLNSFLGKIYCFFWGEQKSEVTHDNQQCIIYSARRIHFFPWLFNIHLFFLFNFVEFNAIKRIFKIFFLTDNPKKESLFIGGFVPMTTCEYTILLEKPEKKGFAIIQTSDAKIIIDRKNAGEYNVDSYFRDTSDKFNFKRMVVPAHEGKISLRILFDGISKTNTISGNDQPPISTPFYSLSSSLLKYPSFSKGYIKISNIALPDQGTSTVLLYALTQSAPRKLITPIGDTSCLPFGFDGPHSYATIKKGLSSMKKYSHRGTMWFDILYLHDENYVTFLKSLIHQESWEAGIHFSKSLTTLSSPEARELISVEYDTILSQLKAPVKSWCSLRNGDNVSFANDVFTTYSMIWRNGETGVHAEPLIGNLEDATWEWWNLASKAGLIFPVFTHETDTEPAIRYSISYSKFNIWLEQYRANGISIIPFHEWWLRNANTHDIQISDISVHNHMLKFRVKTNGEKGLVNVNIAPERDLKITDHHTRDSIEWTGNRDNSISFYVLSDHEYEISTKSLSFT